MLITDLARECGCCHITIHKWAKQNHCKILKEACKNYKQGRALSTEDCQAFKEYWRDRLVMPKGEMTVSQLAKECKVDRKTIILWAGRHDVVLGWQTIFAGNPTHIINKTSAEEFRKEYCPPPGVVGVNDLLKKYSSDWRVAQRWAEQNGVQFIKDTNKGTKRNALLPVDAKKFEKHLKCIKTGGFLYCIQPVPEFNPNRIKFGFGYDVERRMRGYRIICPNLVVLGTWSCRRNMERPAIRAITKLVKCTALTNELFDCDDFHALLKSAGDYFNDQLNNPSLHGQPLYQNQ